MIQKNVNKVKIDAYYTFGMVEDKKMRILIDTGASVCIIAKRNDRDEEVDRSKNITIRAVGGSRMTDCHENSGSRELVNIQVSIK